jgi:hypothetical protein
MGRRQAQIKRKKSKAYNFPFASVSGISMQQNEIMSMPIYNTRWGTETPWAIIISVYANAAAPIPVSARRCDRFIYGRVNSDAVPPNTNYPASAMDAVHQYYNQDTG